MAQSMKKEIRKTFGFAGEKFSAKVRLDTKMQGVPIICPSLYIHTYIHKLQCPASPGGQHMPGASPFHFIAPQFVIEPIQHGSGGETGRLYR